MSVQDEQDLRVRVDAADKAGHICINGHPITGNNIYRDSLGHKSCLRCRAERKENTPRTPVPSRRKAKIPLNPELRRTLRLAAGLPDDTTDGPPCSHH